MSGFAGFFFFFIFFLPELRANGLEVFYLNRICVVRRSCPK